MARPRYSDKLISDRMETILAAAKDILEEQKSVDAISLRKTAKIVGVSSTALYRYFETKQDLITALRARTYRWMQSRLQDAVEKQNNALAGLQSLSRAYIEAGLERPYLYQLLFFEVSDTHDSPFSQILTEAKRDCLDVCTKAVARAQTEGFLANSVDPLTAAHLFWASAHGLVSLEIGNQLVMGRKISILQNLIIETVVAGLKHMDVSHG